MDDLEGLVKAIFKFIAVLFVLWMSRSKKHEEASDEPDSETTADAVRERIEALKRQRNGERPKEVVPRKESLREKPIFSAYKHLPKEEAMETIQAFDVVPRVLEIGKSKEVSKSIDLHREKSRLRNWVTGQVVLGTPAYKRYGNFIRR